MGRTTLSGKHREQIKTKSRFKNILLQQGVFQEAFYNDTEEWLSTMSLISVNKDAQKIQEDGVPIYVQALLEQTAESINSLQSTLGRGEDEKKHLADNFANLAEKMSAVADQIQINQKAFAKGNEKSIDINPLVDYMRDNPNGMDEPTKEHIRNMDISIRRLVEENNQGNKQLITELRLEIKLLAKTISAAVEKK